MSERNETSERKIKILYESTGILEVRSHKAGVHITQSDTRKRRHIVSCKMQQKKREER